MLITYLEVESFGEVISMKTLDYYIMMDQFILLSEHKFTISTYQKKSS